jgi:hypothetical protein
MEELYFYVVRAEMFVISKEQGQFSQFCTGVCEERTWVGDREIAIVGAITTKHLVTTH